MTTTIEARRLRAATVRRLARLAKAARDAPAERDEALIAAHGDKRQGGLTYDELAAATGLSKGRVIQIVQGNSEYSKRLLAERPAK
jgi:hypothetical protein